jgi:nitroreductase
MVTGPIGRFVVYGAMAAPFDLEQADRLLTTTRAVRKRLDLERPVPLEVVLDCIRIATQAPTGGNVQRGRWLVVDDPELRAKLAEYYRRAYEPYIVSQKQAVEQVGRTDASTLGILSSSDYLAEHLHEVPVHVIPCILDRVPANAKQGLLAGFYGSILPAVWSFQLALRARGLGSVWTTLHLEYEREVGELLGIPETVSQVALMPVAWTIGTDFKPGTRRDAEEITYRNTWKAPLRAN